jgi:hypothetical protein
MLAPRMIHFARNQIFWDCATMSACEALPAGLPRQLDSLADVDRRWRRWLQEPHSADSNELGDFWAAAVRTYTRCNLTKAMDKLQAIWGIAQLVRDAQGEEWGQWGAGLWSYGLMNSLMWTVSDYEHAERQGISKKGVLPSWSWASIKGAVTLSDSRVELPFYSVVNHNREDISFQLIESEVERRNNGPYGLACNSIKMQSHLGAGTLGRVEGQNGLMLYLDESPLFRAFPDTKLAMDTTYEFLILAVSKEPETILDEVGIAVSETFQNNEASLRYTYSGFGLLIQPVKKDDVIDSPRGPAVDEDIKAIYSRIGAFKFLQLSQENWGLVRLACGGHADTELEVEYGSLFELI